MKRFSLVGLLIAALGLIALGAVGIGGPAWAYFSSTGSGTGSGTTGTLQIATVALIGGDSPATLLLPGSSGEVVLRVHNPNPSQVTLTDVASSSSITVSGGSGCTATNSGVSFTHQTGLSVPIPPGVGSTVVRLPGAAAMSTSSATGCQGATFSIPVTITVRLP